MSDLEQDFKLALMLSLSNVGIPVYRQIPGNIQLRSGGWVQGTDPGAADLSGIVPVDGWRLEIETKGPVTPHTPEQLRWLGRIRRWGGVSLMVRWKKGVVLTLAVSEALELVQRHIVERREHPNEYRKSRVQVA